MRKGNLERLVAKAETIHFGKYDYSWVLKNEPNSVKDRIKVFCPIHGFFDTTFDGHVHGKNGCPMCSGNIKKTTEQFIKDVNEKIDCNNYTFEKTNYKNESTDVIITCHEKDVFGNEHGDFFIKPRDLLKGCCCPKCSRFYKPTTEEWIAIAEQKHGEGRYDYSQMGEYTGNPQDKGLFICHVKNEDGVEHGPFYQRFKGHLLGYGCPICGGSKKMTLDEFISLARTKHGNRYDYDNFVYTNANTKSWITCKEHGDFLQSPYQHLKGHGCPYCKNSLLEERISTMFDRNDIYYETWNYYNGLGRQSIDFYLPQNHLYIECQGEQHYVPTKFKQTISDEEAKKDYDNRVVLDKQKYDAVTKDGNLMIYYTDPKTFHVNGIDVFSGWYSDKVVFIDKNELLNYVMKLKEYEYEKKERFRRKKGVINDRISWTYELCKEEASKYATRTDFEKGNQPAYKAAQRNGWLDEFIVALNKPRGYWNNKERVIAIAKKCSGARDMYSKYPAAYSSASRHGWTKDLVYGG